MLENSNYSRARRSSDLSCSRINYTQSILRGSALKKYREVLVACKQLEKELAEDEWDIGKLAGLSTEDFWTWANTDTKAYDRHPFLARDKCVNFERELWFEFGKCMWRKNRSVYQYHMKYICNDTVKPFKVKFPRYAERVI